MKKIRKSHIFSFILGALIFGSVGVIAANYAAKDIAFTPKNTSWKKEDGTDITNVKDALDNLYSKNSNDITYIIGANNRSDGIESFKITNDNDNALIVTGQAYLQYSINSTNDFKTVNSLGENYNNCGTYYVNISLKKDDIVYIKRDTDAKMGYIIVY